MSWDDAHPHDFHGDWNEDDDYGGGIDGHDDDYGYDHYGVYDDDGEASDEFGDDESTESDLVLRRNVIISGLHASSLQELVLFGDLWTSFPTMASFRPDLENLLAALETNRSLKEIHICDDILALIGESDQGRLFGSLGNLPNLEHMTVTGGSPGSPTVIHTRVLTEALSQTSNVAITSLKISGFELSSRSEVEQLAAGLKNRAASLDMLRLEDIVLVGEDKTGFLDPILLALAPAPGEPREPLDGFRLSCRQAASNGLSIVSPEALGTFFACIGQYDECQVHLENLGLDDNHCKSMAEQIAKGEEESIDMLNLCGNPSIGQEGHQALLGLLNLKVGICGVDVDDQNWKAKFDLVIYMNNVFNRHLFLKEGVFPSKAMRVNFLAKLTTRTNSSSHIEPNTTPQRSSLFLSVREAREYVQSTERRTLGSEPNTSKLLNAIWYTLREDPSSIYT
jgi:hypothetical protein